MRELVLIFLLGCTVLNIADAQIDPCNKPEFCANEAEVPDPEDCTKYYWCVTGSWMRVNCSVGTLYDSVTLECVLPDEALCQPECPPFTGSTTERVTQKPGTCENVTQCAENEKYPDRSNCRSYYLCTGGRLVNQTCQPGKVFDIYVSDCIDPYDGFDCNYRCVTPAPPTTEVPTTDAPVTHTSGSSTNVYVTFASSTSNSVPSTAGNTDDSGSGNEAVLIGIIIGVVVIIILVIIIIIVVCMKKHRKNDVNPESEILEDELSKEREQEPDPLKTVVDERKNPVHLPPIVLVEEDSEKANYFDHTAFIAKAEKEKRKPLKRFKKTDPTKEEAMKVSKKYKKKLRKELQLRYEAEEKHEQEHYDDKLNLLKNDASVKRQNFRDDLRLACNERNDPAELTALANNYVNSQHANSNARQEVANGRDRILRTRLKDMNLTQTDMENAGLLASDLDGSELDKKIHKFNEQQVEMKESYLQKFSSMASSGASLGELEKLTVSYESQLATLQENHPQERNEATQRLLEALHILALQNLDKLWNKECQTVDKNFDYSATPDDDPGVVKMTLTQHLDALKKAGEEIDSHITNRNLSVALVALTANNKNLKSDSQTTTPLANGSVTKETSAKTKPLSSLPLPMETITDENDGARENPYESIGGKAAGAWENPYESIGGTEAGLNVTEGRSVAPSAEHLEKQRQILALHQQEVEQLQAMRMREKSQMDELLRQKLSERRTEVRVGWAE